MRTSKTVDGVVHNYIYASGKLLRETYGNNVLDFFYDSNGTPFALKCNGTLYYYITNLQGDVMNLVDANGTVVATYDYDPFGNVIGLSGTMATTNPLRYRGYYYDSELGLYYLQSRYYDPELGRFINADGYASTGQGIIGCNMFAYCNNNPVCLFDSTGFVPTFADMDPGAQTGISFGYWLSQELLKPDRDSDGKLTCGGKIKILFNSIRKNIEFSAGIGQGFYAEFILFDFGGSVGAYGNYAAVDYSNERWKYGQEVYVGSSIEIMQWLEIGGAGYEFYQNGQIVTSDSWMGLNSEKESWTLFSLACYPLFFGGSIRLGFDANTFLKETEEVWGWE